MQENVHLKVKIKYVLTQTFLFYISWWPKTWCESPYLFVYFFLRVAIWKEKKQSDRIFFELQLFNTYKYSKKTELFPEFFHYFNLGFQKNSALKLTFWSIQNIRGKNLVKIQQDKNTLLCKLKYLLTPQLSRWT